MELESTCHIVWCVLTTYRKGIILPSLGSSLREPHLLSLTDPLISPSCAWMAFGKGVGNAQLRTSPHNRRRLISVTLVP